MKRIEFHDREREIGQIKDIIEREPTLITFIYGPINSGKTELINYLVKQLPQNYVVFYVNLRGKFITEYKDFVRALFKIELGKEKKEILKTVSEVSVKALKFMGIPITENIVDLLFKEKIYEDVFEFLEDYLTEIAANKEPILILDELQVIGDVKVDDLLIYKLFNFFVRLTKELHLCHVFAVTSDSLFIERVFNEAMLHGRRRYIRVDDFDHETTVAFLNKHGFSDNEKEKTWKYVGGKPVYLVELANSKRREKEMEELLTLRTGELETMLKTVAELGAEIAIGDIRYSVNYDGLVDSLKRYVDVDELGINDLDEVSKRYLMDRNILFVDPLRKGIRPQSQLDLLAIREVLKLLTEHQILNKF